MSVTDLPSSVKFCHQSHSTTRTVLLMDNNRDLQHMTQNSSRTEV